LILNEAMTDLVLASKSPRRAELLRQLGLTFSTVKPEVEEVLLPGESPEEIVLRLARDKSNAVRQKLIGPKIVIAADTVVVIDNRIIGKPKSREDGIETLERLSGREHKVYTGVVISTDSHQFPIVSETKVHFRTLSKEEAEKYWLTGEPVDKAGAYGIQGIGALFVSGIEGSYSNVVGLPLMETAHLLNQLGIDCLALNKGA
jgi:septum formation protein